ncbi:MAG: hypothetical protein J6B87_00230 [Clostridia bacterium]|nr:hypothetical protein [Clostridia bacterium]
MKKIATTFLIVISLIMAIIIMPPSSYAAIEINGYQADEANIVAASLTDLYLSIGDFLTDLLNKIVGERVTMQDLIFNKVTSLDPNFFNKDLIINNETTKIMREQINKWYSFFMTLAIVAYLVVLLGMGTKVVLGSTAGGMEKLKELAVKWLAGVLLLFLFPNVIVKYAFRLNEEFVKMLAKEYIHEYAGTGLGNSTTEGEWSNEEIEFRSPEYVSRFTGKSNLGGEEMNRIYQKSLDSYRAEADLARIMRAYAGITKKMIYAIIWFVLFGQLFVLVVKYYKRYFVIAILLIIFPLVTMYYIIEILRGKNGQVFSAWAKEIFVNIFIQSIHAIIYVLIASVVISRVQADITKPADHMNWILAIVAINFISEGEKIIRKLLGVDSGMDGGIGGTGKAIREKTQGAARNAGQVGRAFLGK